MSDLATLRAAIARAARQCRRHPADDDAATRLRDLRSAYAEARITHFVDRVVHDGAVLSDEQRERIVDRLGAR